MDTLVVIISFFVIYGLCVIGGAWSVYETASGRGDEEIDILKILKDLYKKIT
jgi:hypothetical protein